MRDTLSHYRTVFSNKKTEGITLTVEELAKEVGVTLNHTRSVVRRLQLPCTSKRQLIEVSYRCAVITCRNRDRDGIVTYKDIARERKTKSDTARHYFDQNPHLRELWQVVDSRQAFEIRIRKAAARLNYPEGKLIPRKVLAHELGWSESKLGHHLDPELEAELLRKRSIESIYEDAVQSCRESDRHGVVTFHALAKCLKTRPSNVYKFFETRQDMREKWAILDRSQEVVARIRAAAEYLSKRKPPIPLTRPALAKNLKWPLGNLAEILKRKPWLVQELGVVYSYPNYGTGLRSKKKNK